MIALGVVLLFVAGGIVWFIRNMINSTPPAAKQVVQEIRVIRPPPPPPEVKPPPPPPEEEVDVPEPEQQPEPTPTNEPPPSNQLGVDADGSGAGDGFGLVGNKGGRELLASGGSAFAWYAGLLKTEILDRLQDEKTVRSGSYSVLVRVWVRQDGTIERVRLGQSTGDRERDRIIEDALSKLGRFSQAPPADMPQPINLRIVSRA
jgi:periplasmic protein TonB